MDRKELKEKYNIEIWNESKIQDFQKTLLGWYDKEKRDLPWRNTKDPYKIWVSEIMLQQTRVDTVIPYYNRFLEEFPTIKSLAEAPEDKLLKIWEGLGYYSRVRNMKSAAQQIVLHYDGEFPTDPKEIKKLKGIGPYTSGAISSIAFNHPEPAVDGNLMRVLSRLFEIDLDVKKQSNRKVFEAVERQIIDQDRPGDFNQALMDLGATISTPKNYDPSKSPVKEFNQSYINDTWRKYPITSKKKKPKPVSYISLIIKNDQGEYLLEKRPKNGLLANMWTFPLLSQESLETKQGWKNIEQLTYEELSEADIKTIKELIKDHYNLMVDIEPQTAGSVTHIFSHLKWTIYIFDSKNLANQTKIPDQCEWSSAENFDKYAFPVVQQKIWKEYQMVSLF